MTTRSATVLVPLAATALLLAACAGTGGGRGGAADARTATVQRTAHGVAHVHAPDIETLAYGVAYAHAEDNVCQTAQQLLTVRGQRSRFFGGAALALFGRRPLPNEQIDLFVAAHMDDAALAAAWARTSADAQAMARGYVAGYNRFLADRAGRLPPACAGQPWVEPMTLAQYHRLQEVNMIQAGVGALPDAVLAAQPPAPRAAAAAQDESAASALTPADIEHEARALGLAEPALGSNAWAFGKQATGGPGGLLLGNPHFPWEGVNRFWQMHLTVPGRMDVMGASTGHSAVVHIGFNQDVAWSHTVSTGKRFTLHELALVSGDPTSYLVDGQPEKMRAREVSAMLRGADGVYSIRSMTLWSTRYGPVVAAPRLGLAWSAQRAYALQDANTLNARAADAWLQMNMARSVQDLRAAHGGLGIPWVNTIAADRQGQAMYADISVVPDVDDAMLARCAPSREAAALRTSAAGIVVLDGSRSECNWKRDPASPVPGLIAPARLPVAVRADWVHNSNDSFFHTHPAQRFEGVPAMVGDDIVRRARTRAGLIEVPELVARGPVTAQAAQAQLFANRNTMAAFVLPDLLAACSAGAPPRDAADGCAVLRQWDRHNNVESRGAHLFREFWRAAGAVPGVFRTPFDRSRPAQTPAGLKMDDPAVAAKVWEALAGAVKKSRDAGIALDAPLGSVQRPAITERPIALHGGEELEGVLNNLGNQFAPGLTARGLRIDYGTSYVQTVSFDARGPVAHAILTYGQSTDPASPRATDQLELFSAKQWPRLPFHADEVAAARVGEPLRLVRP